MTKPSLELAPALHSLFAIIEPNDCKHPPLKQNMWPEIVKLAARHRVDGLVARALAEGKITPPDTIRSHFVTCARNQGLAAAKSAKALREIAEIFGLYSIPFILLKGLSLSERYYVSWADRQSIDIDLMVDEAHLEKAESALAEIGFVSESFANIPRRCRGLAHRLRSDIALRRSADEMKIELHFRLFTNSHLLPLSFADLMDWSEILSIGRANVRVLKPHAMLVYLVVHGAKHGWFRLKWLADLDRALPTISDEELSQANALVHQHGIEKLYATSFALLQAVKGPAANAMMPAGFYPHVDHHLLAQMTAMLQRDEVLESFRLQDVGNFIDNCELDFALRDSWRYRFRSIENLLFDIRDIETLRLSARWRLFYWFFGPIARIVRSFARTILPALRSR